MTKLLDENKPNDNSSDVRHRARVTAQQQQHFEELKKLQESLKPKEIIKTDEEPQNKKSDTTPKKAKKVDVSKKKNIFQIITEKFIIAVQPKEWGKIIAGLKNLFLLRGREIELLQAIKHQNTFISSFLARLKNQDIEMEMRIATLLKRLEQNPSSLSSANLVRLSVIQASLIADLNRVGRGDMQQQATATMKTQHIQHLASPNSHASMQLDKIRTIAAELGQSQTMGQFKLQDLNVQSQYYFVNSFQLTAQTQKPFDVLKPIGQIINFAKDVTEKYIIAPIKEAITDLFKHHHHHGDKNCNGYDQKGGAHVHHSHGNHIHHKGHVHGPNCGCHHVNVANVTFSFSSYRQSSRLQDIRKPPELACQPTAQHTH